MADIKRAAKWMQEGKRVRRHKKGLIPWILVWDADQKYIVPDADVPFVSPAQIAPEDLLADDWEIAD